MAETLSAGTMRGLVDKVVEVSKKHLDAFGPKHGYRFVQALDEPDLIVTALTAINQLAHLPQGITEDWQAVALVPGSAAAVVLAPGEQEVKYHRVGPGEYALDTGAGAGVFCIGVTDRARDRVVRLLLAASELAPFYSDGEEYWLREQPDGSYQKEPYQG